MQMSLKNYIQTNKSLKKGRQLKKKLDPGFYNCQKLAVQKKGFMEKYESLLFAGNAVYFDQQMDACTCFNMVKNNKKCRGGTFLGRMLICLKWP